MLCFAIFALVYLGFVLSVNVVLLTFCFVFYGVYSGAYRAVGKTFVTDIAPQEYLASGVGWYAGVVGITGLLASTVGGWLWTTVAPSATFLSEVICSVVAIPALLSLVSERKRERSHLVLGLFISARRIPGRPARPAPGSFCWLASSSASARRHWLILA